MNKVDLYLFVLSMVLLTLAVIKFFQNGDFFIYLLIATAVLIRSVKELVPEKAFKILGVLVTVIVVIYIICYVLRN